MVTDQLGQIDYKPTVYVISGPNGAGKTTFATEFLPHFAHCREFLNADLIAAGLSPFHPESQNVRAGRLLLERIAEIREQKLDFGFETTLSGRTYMRVLSDLQTSGYRIELFFLWLPSAEMAVNRVANRVRQGGHNIPVHDIRRRYKAGLRNLFHLYRERVDCFWLYDASSMNPEPICCEVNGKLTKVNSKLFDTIEIQAGE
ncbi:MAG: zeta toxin family protein [Zavarzinella sp.]